MVYRIESVISEKANASETGISSFKAVNIPYLQYSKYADLYACGPAYMIVLLSEKIVADDFEKVFEFQTETVKMLEAWQIYAESSDFERCIIRHVVWDKERDRQEY